MELRGEGEDLPLDYWADSAAVAPRPTWSETYTISHPAPAGETVKTPEDLIRELTFGLEIEALRIKRIPEEEDKKYKLCYRLFREHCGVEARSDVLTFKSWWAKGSVATADLLARMDVADNAGLHIHVGLLDLFRRPTSLRQALSRLAGVWRVVEPEMLDLAARRETRIRYCARLGEKGEEAVAMAEKEKGKRKIARKAAAGQGDRYHAMNLQALEKHGTVEFRLWNSLDDWNYLETALIMSTGVVAYAVLTRTVQEKPTAAEVWDFLEKEWKPLWAVNPSGVSKAS